MSADAGNAAGGLYRAELLEHSRHPVGAAKLGRDAPGIVRKVNPACGDEVRLRLVRGPEGRIVAVEHETRGCAVCVASASMLAAEVAARGVAGGMSDAEALAREKTVLDRLKSGGLAADDGALQALNGLARFPARLACARLAWETFAEAATPPPPPALDI